MESRLEKALENRVTPALATGLGVRLGSSEPSTGPGAWRRSGGGKGGGSSN